MIACPSPRFRYDSKSRWTFSQIADAFYEYGIKPWNFNNPTDRTKHIPECVAALTIVAGECALDEDPSFSGCNALRSGPSGS